MTPASAGALAGLMLGVGVCLVLWRLAARRITLLDRVTPYLRERPRRSRLLAERHEHTPFPTLERLVAPWLHDAGRFLERLGSSSASIRRRLNQSGDPITHDQFRTEQLAWGAVGLAVGLFFAITLGVVRGAPILPLLVAVLLCGVGGAVARDQALTRNVARRREQMKAELPDVAELLALAVGAGEGAVGALERITRSTRGALSDEIRRTLSEARSGVPLTVALERMAARTGAP